MFISIIIFILVLSLLVFVHELGHFLVAKKIGVRVEEFGFGLPPRIWGKKRGETIYSINWLPIGGFVKLSGEDANDESSKNLTENERRRLFWARGKKERALVLLAGVTMNFILAVAIISFIFTKGVALPKGVMIDEIMANSPASVSGLEVKDTVIEFAGKKINNSQELISITREKSGQEVNIVVLRSVNGEVKQITVNISPRVNPPANEGPLGIKITTLTQEVKYAWYQAPFYGLAWALKFSYMILMSLFDMLYKLATFQQAKIDVGGPIAIYKATEDAVKFGRLAVLNLIGLLSLNLAIFNLLPIPALDGGRLMFVIFEKFLGRRVKPKAELLAHQVGMAFLIALIILVTINDILRSIRN